MLYLKFRRRPASGNHEAKFVAASQLCIWGLLAIVAAISECRLHTWSRSPWSCSVKLHRRVQLHAARRAADARNKRLIDARSKKIGHFKYKRAAEARKKAAAEMSNMTIDAKPDMSVLKKLYDIDDIEDLEHIQDIEDIDFTGLLRKEEDMPFDDFDEAFDEVTRLDSKLQELENDFRTNKRFELQLDREELAESIFRKLDVSNSNSLDRTTLRRFADLSGFEGTDADWDMEFDLLCEDAQLDPSVGFDLPTFVRLVNNPTDEGIYCSRQELEDIHERLMPP